MLATSACSVLRVLPVLAPHVPIPVGRGEPLTTKLADARAPEPWLEIIDPRRRAAPQELAGAIPANLPPGYFRIHIKSFCLHAGAPANAKGEGFGLAPYHGSRADVLQHLIARSARHPELVQSDVQQIVWALESGHTVDELPPGQAAIARELLDTSDLASLAFGKDALEAFANASFGASFRIQLVDVHVPYEELARIAVPAAPDPANLGPSHWNFVGRGLYVRATSQSYRETVLELYRPAPYTVERDPGGHIVSITSGHTKATILTDPRRGHGVTFRDLDSGYELFVPDSARRGRAPSVAFGFPDEHPVRDARDTFDDLEDDYEALKRALEKAQASNDPASVKQRGLHALDEMQTDQYLADMLKAGASTDLKAKAFELQKWLYDITDVAMYVVCAMRGQCTPGAGDDGDAATSAVAVPFDTGRQRLGLSNAAFN